MREKYIYLMGHAYANYFSKAYIVSYRKIPKQNKFTVSFLGKIPLKLKKIPKKNQTISILVKQLLACYCGSTTLCRGNGNCVDPNHTDS